LYGKQRGAVVSYNPHKPGCPSHALHTYWVDNQRLVLDVVAHPATSTARPKPDLFKLRQTVGVNKLLSRQFARDDWSTSSPSSQGWSVVEDTLKLLGWDKSRC